MEVRIPIGRKDFVDLIKAALGVLFGRRDTLKFNCKEVNGKRDPIILSKGHLAELQQSHMEALARATAMQELMEDALDKMQPNDPAATLMRVGLETLERRVIH